MLRKLKLSFLFLFSVPALAYTPQPGQMFRFQQNLLRNQKAFQTKGSALVGRSKIEYTLQWWSPGNYQVVLEGLPKALYQDGNPASTWTLMRQGSICILRTSSQVVQCSKNSLWAQLEFSGRADVVARSLQDFGILDATEATYNETHSKDYRVDPKSKKVRLVVAQNGNKPVAAVELRSAGAAENPNSVDYPILQIDQTFLAPLMARFSQDGQLLTVRASSDLELRRGHTRYTYVLADKVEVLQQKTVLGVFSRGEMKALPSKTPPQLPKAIADLSALRDQLSSEGKDLLLSLLATH